MIHLVISFFSSSSFLNLLVLLKWDLKHELSVQE